MIGECAAVFGPRFLLDADPFRQNPKCYLANGVSPTRQKGFSIQERYMAHTLICCSNVFDEQLRTVTGKSSVNCVFVATHFVQTLLSQCRVT